MGRLNKIEYLPIALALSIALGFMLYFLTASPLWYDEAVEYFYSKVMNGHILGEDTSNMYQRICSTYQPPLYNVIMFVWLSICDAEWWYRLLGVIVTLVGGVGLYKGLNLLVNNKLWSSVSMLVYLFSPFVFEYALECAEYNLMLCFNAWSIFFFLKSMTYGRLKDYIMYFLFAVLAVYSQYGAAIAEVVLFTVLMIDVIRRKNTKQLKGLLICTFVTIVFAAVPLMLFFMLPQMEQQGTLSVSHSLFFAHGRHGRILVDMVYCLRIFASTVLCANNITAQAFVFITFLISSIAIATRKDKLGVGLLCSLFAMGTLYYLLVALSMYGYNSWAGRFGTANFGGRYMLFLLPLFFLVLQVGLYQISMFFSNKWHGVSLCGTMLVCVFLLVCFIRQDFMTGNRPKDDVRNLVVSWYSKTDKDIPTFVHDWQYFNFLYYVSHSDSFRPRMIDNVTKINRPTNNYDEIESRLRDKGVFRNECFYLVMSQSLNNYSEFIKVLSDNGYVYDTLFEGETKLLKVEKNE